MSANVWAPVAAAVGASLLTVLGSYWLERNREGRRDQGTKAAQRRDAYITLLNTTISLILTADALRMTAEERSGFGESLDIFTRQRKPVEPMDIFDRMHDVVQPVLNAVNIVWIYGSQDAVRLANRISAEAVALMGVPVGEGTTRLKALAKGVKSSPEEMERRLAHIKVLGDLRRELATLARHEIGLQATDLKAGYEDDEATD